MGSVGDAYDNAMCESFFATLECELLDRRRFASQAEARMACFSFIEGWYNTLSAAGYVPGYYENPYTTSGAFPGAFCSAISSNSAIASKSILWSDEPENTGWTTEANAPGFAPARFSCNGSVAGSTLGWQYAGAGGSFNVDSDEINASVPLW